MKKFFLSLMPFFMVAMCVCSFTACSSDDDDDDDKETATEYLDVDDDESHTAYRDVSDAVVGEYVGDVSISGYTGTVPTTVTLTKRTSTMVNMILDSEEADIHTESIALNVTGSDGVYTVSDKYNTVKGTISGKSLALTMTASSGSLLFNGLR